MRQQADLSDMIWDVRDIIAFCSQSVTLKAGDLIMTGTPAGVGAVTAGDVLEGGVENIGELKVTLS
jgi:fumarylpyruvate hydrolase